MSLSPDHGRLGDSIYQIHPLTPTFYIMIFHLGLRVGIRKEKTGGEVCLCLSKCSGEIQMGWFQWWVVVADVHCRLEWNWH